MDLLLFSYALSAVVAGIVGAGTNPKRCFNRCLCSLVPFAWMILLRGVLLLVMLLLQGLLFCAAMCLSYISAAAMNTLGDMQPTCIAVN